MIVLMETDFPDPVAPAMRRCGIFARSATTGSPSRFLPSATGRTRLPGYCPLSSSSRMWTRRGMGFGTSMPTAAFPGMGATIRSGCARMASAKASARAAIRPTLTPEPGATSYCVTTGPTVRPAIEPSTRNVCSVSISLRPIWSIWVSPASPSPGGAGFNKSTGGIKTPFGTTAGRTDGGVFTFRDFGEGGSVKGASGFLTSRFSAFPLPPSLACSRVLSTTSGCQPTVRRPNADSANTPTSTPPAVPTVWCTPWARAAGNTPTSLAVGDHAEAIRLGGERHVLREVRLGELARRFGVLERLLPARELLGEHERRPGRVVQGDLAGPFFRGLHEPAGGVGVLDRELLLSAGADDHQVAPCRQQPAGGPARRPEGCRRPRPDGANPLPPHPPPRPVGRGQPPR